MKKLFTVEVAIIATAYIVAESEEEAQKKIDSCIRGHLEFSSRRQDIGVDDEIVITGESFNADMPEISLSPAMTFNAPQGRVHFSQDLEEEEDA